MFKKVYGPSNEKSIRDSPWKDEMFVRKPNANDNDNKTGNVESELGQVGVYRLKDLEI